MEFYPFVKFLHVLFVIVWLGGGFVLVLLGLKAQRANSSAELVDVIMHVVYLSNRVFVPAAILALIFGVTGVIITWSFGDLWVLIGLAGFALTFLNGVAVLRPRSDRVKATIDREGPSPAAIEQSRQILRIAQFDFVMLYVIVADMVIKPTSANYITLIIMAIVVVVGAVYFLGRPRAPATANA
jgi:uncharacterized membrane protein